MIINEKQYIYVFELFELYIYCSFTFFADFLSHFYSHILPIINIEKISSIIYNVSFKKIFLLFYQNIHFDVIIINLSFSMCMWQDPFYNKRNEKNQDGDKIKKEHTGMKCYNFYIIGEFRCFFLMYVFFVCIKC